MELMDHNSFQWSYLSLAHGKAAVDLTGVICKMQVRALVVSMVICSRKVVKVSECMWLVAHLHLQFL